jgi:hypothetical protein
MTSCFRAAEISNLALTRAENVFQVLAAAIPGKTKAGTAVRRSVNSNNKLHGIYLRNQACI